MFSAVDAKVWITVDLNAHSADPTPATVDINTNAADGVDVPSADDENCPVTVYLRLLTRNT